MPAPTLAQIRAAIKAKLEAVATIGTVHDYERFSKRDAEFQALYKTSNTIKGWNIRRVSTREARLAVGRYQVFHRWRIRGYMALDDSAASEKTFDTLIEAVKDAFRADETLSGLVKDLLESEQQFGIQVEDSGPVMFAGVLCHGARLGLTTMHFQ